MLLEFNSVTAGYGGGDVLRDVNLSIDEGTLTCIVGPNGAGKSTALRVISGLLKPRLGSVTFQGKPIGNLGPRQVIALGIVQVPQEHSLFPQMTVLENVRMGAYTVRDRRLIEQRLDHVGELFPIVRDRAQDKAGSLSGGQQRLVEFARCLMLDPTLILLDEPSMGLDPRTLKLVLDNIVLMREAGKTVLLVEQNARSGLKISTHGVVMESGTVRLSGEAGSILENPQIGDLYLGGTLEKAATAEGKGDSATRLRVTPADA